MQTKLPDQTEKQLDQAFTELIKTVDKAKKEYYLKIGHILKRIDDRKIEQIQQKLKK